MFALPDWLRTVGQDLHFALRMLRKSPGFTAVALLTLALGIGANSAIFSVVNGVLLEPLPYRQSDRLAYIYSQFPTLGFDEFWVSPPEYRDLQERALSFQSIGAWRTGRVNVAGADNPLRVTAAVVSAEFFTTLGVSPILGRPFNTDEDTPNGPAVAVISRGLWQRAFGGDPQLVGKRVQIDGEPTTITGVMPADFDIEDAGVDVWMPARLGAHPTNRSSHYLHLVGRLAPGVTLARARTEMRDLVANWRKVTPEGHVPTPEGHPIRMRSLQDQMTGGVRTALLLLLAAVGLVMLIAVANVGNLLLAKSEGRRREVAVRSAIGAGRGRLARQFLTESVVLAAIGGALGLLLGWVGLRLMLATSPDSLPRLREIVLDWRVVGFTAAVSLLAGLIFGLAPLLHLSARSMAASLKEGGQRTTAAAARQRLRRGLVVVEVALAVVLVIGAGLLIRSLGALQRVDPGFDTHGMLTFQLYLPEARYPDAAAAGSFYSSLLDRLEALPGVQSAAAMSGLPPLRNVDANDTRFEGLQPTPDRPFNVDYYQTVQGDYFETMGIPIVEGRGFQPGDDAKGTPVLLINETLAKMYYPDQDPIGRRIQPSGAPFWLTVVGVVRDVKQGGLSEATGTELYFNNPQVAAAGIAQRTMNIVVRTTRPPLSLAGEVRRAVGELDPALPLAHLQTMQQNIDETIRRPRFLTLLLGIFAVLALTLAAVGTYGVLAYAVAERSHEIGIRMAMGARSGSVLGMVLKSGLALAGTGLVLGVLGAVAATRLMRSLLFGVSTTDTTTFLLAPAVLVLVAVAACLIPAHRATRVDPAVVLRES
ncbi:MAG TPA: ABC transporter permease [Longimicrobiales bacterium]|nr:ABC transporter permease [Longimicrobiales bacterium]